MDLGLPNTADRWRVALVLALGAMVGWVAHPGPVWLVASPWRWAALMLATARRESLYTASAVGDLGASSGTSVGVLQFNAAVGAPINREDVFSSGYFSAGYFNRVAYRYPFKAALVRLPVLGYGALEGLWRGPSLPPDLLRPWTAEEVNVRAAGVAWLIFGAASCALSWLLWRFVRRWWR